MTADRKIRVLHADDDHSTLDAMRLNLHRLGYDIHSVDSGTAALQRAQAEEFDVVLLDIGMPGLSGIDLLRQLRRTDSDLPVIMLTGMSGNDELFDSVNSGCNGFLEKPCSPDDVDKLIRDCLRDAR